MKSMSDHEFEKKVQSSLEQLKLRPSVAVWAAVESNIRKEKRRRRMILWLPICLLFLGAGGYFMLQGDRQSQPQNMAVQTTVPATDNTSSNTNTNTSDNNSTLVTPETTSTTKDKGPAPVKEVTLQPEAAPAHQPIVKAAAPAIKIVKEPKAVKEQPEVTGTKQQLTDIAANRPARKRPGRKEKGNPLATKETTADKAIALNATDTANTGDVATLIDSVVINNTPDSTAFTATTTVDSTALAMNTPVDSATKETDQVKQPDVQAVAATPAIKPIVRQKIGRWQWGVQAEGGFSGITQDGLFGGLFGFLNNTNTVEKVADLSQASPVFNGQSNAYAPQFPRPVNKPSDITMGPSFSIGGFVQRKLSKRLSLSIGLQYAYQSTRTVVGSKVDNSRTINRAPATAQVVSSYYDANNTEDYTNQYHFIEIPLTLHTQLNKGIRLPLVWDIGFSAAHMIGTSALHYDGLGGVYYKDNDLFNKTQWVVATGFNVGLFQQSKHPLLIGPSVRYNTSNLLKKDYNTSQHLWSVGLKATVLLKK
jgi:cytoskeletal protein RodZ